MRELMNVDVAILEQRVVAQFEHPPGTTWRTCRSNWWWRHTSARVTYQPIDPWDLTKRVERPYQVFINGAAQLAYASLEAAHSHLRLRGFNPLSNPQPLYPNETDVSATAF